MCRFVLLMPVLLLSALAVNAQNEPTPPPQSPRQALLEMFLGVTPNHLEKHLPEVARKALQQLDTGAGPLAEISIMASQARTAGSSFQTFDSGPILLLAEESPMQQKIEVVVEQDNLVGEQNQIDLSFHTYRAGLEERLPFIPRLTFMMKSEKGMWKLNEVSFTARMPLGDPNFLRGFVKDLKKQQRSSNEAMASSFINNIISAENAYHLAHSERGFTCSLSELAQASSQADAESAVERLDPELASGKKKGYIFALTGCDGLHFKVAAEPAIPGAGQRAYCADQDGEIKFASDGKATTCLTRGQSLSDANAAEATSID